MRFVRIFLAAAAVTFTMLTAPSTVNAAESVMSGTTAPASTTVYCVPSTGTGYCVETTESGTIIPCPSRWICLYTDANWTGMQVRWQAGNWHPNFTEINCPGDFCDHGGPGFSDETSSWANNSTGIRYCVSEHEGGGGWDNSMPSGTQGAYIGNGYNDAATSLSRSGCP